MRRLKASGLKIQEQPHTLHTQLKLEAFGWIRPDISERFRNSVTNMFLNNQRIIQVSPNNLNLSEKQVMNLCTIFYYNIHQSFKSHQQQ